MTGVAAATLGVGLATTAATMYSGAKQREAAQQGVDVAREGQQQQTALQKAIADRQYRLATSGQTDERGNQLIYDPATNTWKSILSPEGQELLNRSDAITRMHDVETLGRSASERSLAYERRLAEGETASPILDALRYNYGGPTKEGVTGANKVAAVTGASESADAARNAYTGAALRTGFGYAPLEHTLASVDRSATGGIRSAIANADATGNSAFEAARNEFQTPRANLYNALATRASNTENVPFAPYNISDTNANALLNRAARAPASTQNPYAGVALNQSSKNLIDAIGKYPADTTGQAVGTAGNALLEYFKSQTKTAPVGSPTIERTGSKQVPYVAF